MNYNKNIGVYWIHEKNILSSEFLYNDIKKRGLEFSVPSSLLIPEVKEPKKNLLSKFGELITKKKKEVPF